MNRNIVQILPAAVKGTEDEERLPASGCRLSAFGSRLYSLIENVSEKKPEA
jgi:hypothetical protein